MPKAELNTRTKQNFQYNPRNMEGDSRRSPEGDRKALWKHGNVQFDREKSTGIV